MSVEQRHAFPIRLEQIIRAPKPAEQPKPSRKQRGRPKGSKTKDQAAIDLSPYLQWVKGLIQAVLMLTQGTLSIRYLLLDGQFGNAATLAMAQQCNLHLISKLRQDSELYLPYTGNDGRCKYGERLNPRQLDTTYRVHSSQADGIQTEIYQLSARHPKFAQLLNVVFICKTKLSTGEQSHAILFSSDLSLEYAQLIDYYALRFQIEFNFRDAKQYWGLEDFMLTSEQGVYNAANLALFMVSLSYRLVQQMRSLYPDFSVLDLKAWCRGYTYVREILKWLPEKPDAFLSATIIAKVANLGAIHPVPTP